MLSAFGKVFRTKNSRFEMPEEAKPLMRVLEPRVLLDAAAVETARDAAEQAVHTELANSVDMPSSDDNLANNGHAPEKDLSRDVVFVDGGIDDLGAILNELDPDVEVHILDLQADGVQQMAELLDGRSDLSAVHIFSHGGEGFLNLGSGQLSGDSISGSHVEALMRIGSALGQGGDILIYGCNFGAGTEGRAAAEQLAAVTGADVAASDDLTGAEDKGGDWDLEVEVGEVEEKAITVESYGNTLDAFVLGTVTAPTVDLQNTRTIDGTSYGGVDSTAIWEDAGTVDTGSGIVTVDIVATVIAETSATLVGVNFGTRDIDEGGGGDPTLDDFRVQVRNGGAATGNNYPTENGGTFNQVAANSVTIRWEVFIADTWTGTGTGTKPASADLNFTISDIDGGGGLPNSREEIAANLTNLSSYTVQDPTNMAVVNDGTNISVSGTQPANNEQPSWVQFSWGSIDELELTYTTHTVNAFYNHDGDGDLVFSNPNTAFATGIDLDVNDSSGAAGSNYQTIFFSDASGGSPVEIADGDISVSNAGDAATSAVITLAGDSATNLPYAGDQLNFDASVLTSLGLSASSTVDASGNTIVTIVGAASTLDYQTAIQSITFENQTVGFDTTARSIDVQVFDNAFASGIANTAITFGTIVNQPSAIRDIYVGDEDTTLIANAASGLLNNDVDPTNDPLTLVSAIDSLGAAITVNVVGAASPVVHTLPSGSLLTLYDDGSFSYVPPADYSGVEFFNYTIEDPGGLSSQSYASINIRGVADAPNIPVGVESAASNEDQDTNAVDVTATQGDADGSESLRYLVDQIPAGFTITDGTRQFLSSSSTDVAYLDGWDLTNISLIRPATDDHSDEDILVQLTVEASEPNGSMFSSSEAVRFNVAAVADAPTLNLSTSGGGAPDVPTPLASLISADLVDTDGSESIVSYTLSNWPAGFQLLDGGTPLTPTAGPHTILVADLVNISVQTTPGFLGTFTLDVVATSSENNPQDDVATLTADSAVGALSITIDNVDDPVIAVNDDAGTVLSSQGMTINVLTNDSILDGGATITQIDGATISVGSPVNLAGGQGTIALNPDGTLTFIGNPTYAGDFSFSYTVVDADGDSDTADVTLSVIPDTDSDGIANALDIDDDNDGIIDVNEGLTTTIVTTPVFGVPENGGTSLQTIDLSAFDIDIGDNVSVSNVTADGDLNGGANETFTLDFNGGEFLTPDLDTGFQSDGTQHPVFPAIAINLAVIDIGGGVPGITIFATSGTGVDDLNGMTDGLEYRLEIEVIETRDTDNDGIADHLDIDSDNDGITDNVEAQATEDYIAPSGNDTDNDGLDDSYDADNGSADPVLSAGLTAVDTDGDLTADYLDTDSDDDGTADVAERGDGGPTSTPAGPFNDSDGDGLLDEFEGSNINDGFDVNDENLDATNSNFNLGGVPTLNPDGSNAVPIDVDLLFRDVNNAPDASNDSVNVTEDVATLLNPTAPVDVDDLIPALTVTVTQVPSPAQGVLTYEIGGAGGGTFGTVATTGPGSTLTPAELATISFAPTAEYNGAVDDFTYTVTDDDGASDAGSDGVVSIVMVPVNDAPDAANDSVNVTEDTFTALSPTLPTDVDDVAVDLTVTVTQMPTPAQGILIYRIGGTGPIALVSTSGSGSTLTVAELGSVSFSPALNYEGPVTSFTYTVTDDEGASDAGSNGSVAITMVPQNDAPTGTAPPVTTPEDTPVGGTVTMTDPDTGDTPEATLGTGPVNGSVVVNLDGTYTYTPDPDYAGPDSFEVIVTDDAGLTDTVTVTVTVTPVNDAPVGTAPPVTTPEDTPVGGTVTMTDPDTGDTPEATLGTGPVNGSVVVNLDGTYTYTPDPDYAGPDSFEVIVTDDAGLTDTVTVTVTVTPVNDAPTGTAPPVTTPEDTAVGGTVTMTDPDTGDTPEATLGTGPANGSVVVNLDGTYTYTPDPDYAGPDSFEVIVTDDAGLTDTVTVTVTVTPVNDAPVGTAPPVTTPEDTPVGGTVTMTDPDTGDTPEATLGTGPVNGSVVVNLDGTYTYTPDPDYAGPDSFEVIVTDDAGLTDTVTVTVTVTPVNDAPTGTAPPVTTPEDTPVGGTVTMTDPDTGDTPEATLGTGPVNGSVVVNLDGTYTYTPDPDYAGPDSFEVIVTDDAGLTDTVTVTVTVTPVNDAPVGTAPPVTTPEDTPVGGTVTMTDPDTGDTPEATLGTGPSNGSVVVNLDGTYTYTPDPDYAGPDSFEVIVTDDAGLTDTVTVTVTVTPVNDAPTGTAPPVTTPEDTPVGGTVTMTDPDTGDTPEATLGTGPANGSVVVNLDGTYTYTPDPDYAGPDSFEVIVTDDAGLTDTVTVTVTVTPVNDAPVGTAPPVTTPEDTPVGGTVTMTDPDTGDTPEATLGTGPVNGSVVVNLDGTYTYTPDPDYAGPDSFEVIVTDDAGLTDTVTVTVTVTPVNDAPTGTAPPVTTPEDTAVGGTVTMTDPDTGDTPEATLGTGPVNGSVVVNLDGTYTYTPDPDYAGPDSFEVIVTDDAGLTDTVTVTVTVTPVNDAPVGTAPPVTTPEDTPVGGTVTMSDPDTGDTPEATLGTGPSNGSVVVNLDGTYTYTPDPDYAGPDSFEVIVTDDAGLTDTVTVTVTVTPVNDAPTGTAPPVTTPEDTPVGGTVTMTDPDTGDTPEATLGTGPANGSVVVNLDGTYTYTPDPDYAGPDSFEVIVTDDAGLTDTVTVTVTVTPVNDAPVGTAPPVTTPEDTPVGGTVTMSDPDTGDTPEATLGTGPSNGSVVVNLDGTYTYTPDPDYAGPDSFEVIVTDDAGLTDTVTVTVTVTPVNDAPTGTAPPVTTPEDTPVGGTVTMTDPDTGDTPEATLGTGPANGSVVVNLDGTYTYTPDPDYAGPDSFEVIVTDDAGLTDTVTVTVTVTPVNDAPTGTAPPVTTPEDTPVGGTVTMSDPDTGDTPEATLGTGPVNGSVVVNLDGTYTYTPDPDYAGPDSFEVIVTDDAGLTDTVTVTVTVTPVNDAPDAAADTVNVPENTATPLNPTLPVDVDDVAADLTITVNQVPTPAQGTLTYTLDLGGTTNVTVGTTMSTTEFASLIFTPVTSYTGPVADLTYTVMDDDGLSDAGSDGSVALIIGGINDAPDAFNDSVNVTEDTVTPLNPTLPTDVDDVAADLTITVNQVPPPAQGTLTYTLDLGGMGNVTVGTTMSTTELATVSFSPALNYEGPVTTFTYTVTDDEGASDAGSNGSVAITMVPENDAPVGTAPPVTTPEDTPVGGTVTMTDPDTGDTPEATLGTGPANGSVVVNLDGTYTYTPDPDYAGPDSFEVIVTDDAGLTDTVTVTVTVTPVNDAPVGTAPPVTTPEDTPVGGTVTMSDPDTGDTPEATLGTGPSNGSVVVNLDGTYTYTPDPDYAGPDSFEVIVTDDAGLTDTVTVTVTVTPVNDAPTGTAPPVTTPEDTPVGGTVTMSDPDTGDTPEATLGTGPSNGSVVVNLDGTYTYTPDPDYAGPDSFEVIVTDDAGLTDTVTVTVTVTPVNDAPVGTAPPVTTPEDTPVGGTVTMSDPDTGDTPEATLGTGPVNGSVVVNLDGTYTYTPDPDYAGPDSFEVIVTDDAGLTDTVTVTVTVTPVNDAPDAAADTVNVPENTATPLNPTLPVDVDDVAADLTITVNQVPTPAQGTLTYTLDLGGTTNVTVGTTMSTTEFASLIFTPVTSYTGPVADLTYTVMDDDGLSDAGSDGSVALIIGGINDAPDAFNDSVNVTEDTVTPLNPTLPTDVDDVAADLTITVNQVPPPAQGTLTYTLDLGGMGNVTVGTTMSTTELATVSFSPALNYEGPVTTFTYTVTDDEGASDAGSNGSVAITMVPENDAPVGTAPPVTTPEDTPVGGTVTMTDPDTGDTPEATLGTGPANGSVVVNLDGTYTYTPDPDYAGPDSFEVIVTDDAGLTDTVTVTVTVTPVNDAPVGTAPPVTTPEDTPVGGTVTMSDPDTGDTPEATLGTGPSNGSVVVNLDGTYTYTPDPDYAGPDSFEVIVTDDAGLTDTVTVTVTVTPVNDAPTGTAPPVTTPEDTPVGGTVTMTDPDTGDTPEATLGTGPANGSVVVNLDGTYTYTPDPDYAGPDSFEVIVTDDAGLTDTVTVTVTVTPVNDAPTGTAPPVTTPEDTPVGGTVTMTDPDTGDTPEATLGTGPVNGSVVVNLDGTYTYTPDPDYAGPDSFEVIVTDDAGLTDTVTVTVTVTPVNDAPDAAADTVNVPENTATPLNPTLPVDVDDVAADLTITVNQVPTPAQGTLTYTLDLGGTTNVTVGTTMSTTEFASLIFTPVTSYTGPVADLTYTVMDDDGLSDAGSDGSVALIIGGINDAPDAFNDSVNVTEDTVTPLNPTLPTDVDDVAADLTITVNQVPPPAQGTLTYTLDLGGMGNVTVGTTMSTTELATVSFSPALNYEGPVTTFTYTVTDDEGASDAGSNGSVAITMVPENDAPVGTAPPVTTPEDTPVGGTVTMTDPDTGDTPEATLGTGPANGSVVVNLDGTYTYTPDPDYAGPDSFEVIVTDDAGLTDTVTVTVTVTPVNDAPDAAADTVNVPENTATPLNPTLPVDVDDVAADLTITVNQVPTPAQGTLTYTLDLGGTTNVTVGTTMSTTEFASLIFTPVTSYTGPVADLTYTVMDDDGLSDAGSDGSVALIIGGINDAPDAFNDSVNVTEDTVTPLNPTLPTDVDDVAADLTITVNQVPTPSQGTLIFEVGGAGTGTFAYVRTTGSGSTLDVDELATVTFTPAQDYTGPVDLFTYTVTDDEGASDAGSVGSITISITPVNDNPSAVSAPVTTAEDTPVNAALTLVDPDGDTVQAALDSGPANGTASVNSDGSWSYTPDPDWHGTDTFVVALDDGAGGTSTATVTVIVTPVADIADDAITTAEDTPIIVNVITGANTDGGIGGSGSDTFNASPVVTGVTQGLNGSVVFAVNGDLTYTPDPDYNGPDSFTYTVMSGGREETATVTVNVTPVNDLPTGSAPPVITPEDVPVSGTITVDDPDGDTPTLTVTTPPVSGTVVVQPDGTYTYTPDPDFFGVDSFVVTLEDPDGGTSTVLVQVTVTPENDAPVGTAPPVTTPEDTPVSGSITMTDPDGDVVTATLTNPPMHGTVTVQPNGDWDYVPDPDYNGPDSFLVTIEDTNGATTPVLVGVTVTPVNDLPVASAPPATTPEDTLVSGNVSMSDPDGTPPTASLFAPPVNGSVVVQPNGDWEYTPSPDFNGVDTFDVLVSDPDGGAVTVTVQVTVTPVNDAPIASAPPATTPEDTPVSGVVTMSDPDGPTPVASLATPPVNGTVTVQPDGSWTYTPDPDFSGADSFIVEVTDSDGAKTPVIVDVDVVPVNDPPVAGPPLPPVTSTDASFVSINVAPVFSDVDSPLTYSETGLPAGLTIDPVTGLITGTLSSDASVGGPYTVTVSASDGVNPPVTTTVVIEVDNVDPIALAPYSDTVYEQLPVSIDGSTLVEDPDGDTLTWSSPNLPSWLTVDPATGLITGTPPEGAADTGPVQFSLVADDGQGGIASTVVTLTILEGDTSFIEPPVKVPGEDIDDEPKEREDLINDVPPFVVDAVNDIESLNGTRTIDGEEGIVATTVENVANLKTTKELDGTDPAVLKAVEAIESLRRVQVSQFNGLNGAEDEWNVEGLTGFSVRFGYGHNVGSDLSGVDGSNGENSSVGELIIETYVRQRILFIDVNNTFDPAKEGTVKRYHVEMADGSKVPDWIRIVRDGFIVAERPANMWDLDLKISAVMEHGEIISRGVRIHGPSGEIQPIKIGELARMGNGGKLFTDQLADIARKR